jgi:acetyl-CoA C-acetyltransferase
MQRAEIVILDAARTVFGRFFGGLRALPGPELAARVIDELLGRGAVTANDVEALYAGVGMASAGVFTPARLVVLESRLPDTTPSLAVDRACCSGMTAIGLAWKELRAGQAQLVICGGFESLSRTPILAERQRKSAPGDLRARDSDGPVYDPLLLKSPVQGRAIADYTGEEALAHGVDRSMQDEWALRSHERFFAAERAHFFEAERLSVAGVTVDEGPRADTDLEQLARLDTIYQSPTITAGNAPGLSDGAAFLILATAEKAEQLGVKPLARIVDYVQVADGPTSGSYTPAIAIARLLQRGGLRLDDLGLIEINEAYAATPLVSTLKLGKGSASLTAALRARTNIHGGAVAIGHPLGASGARITMTLAHALTQRGGGLGAAAICGGYGQGDALLLEV